MWLNNLVFDLFAAGHDTTANTLSWAVMFMVNNPDCQAKVQEELDRVCGCREPSTSDRPNLPYTEATIWEIFRVGAILPMALPHKTTKDMNLHGYFLPKGTVVMPQVHLVHENPKEFPNPEKFDPTRFIKNGVFEPHPHVINFSVGKRRCLGEALAKVSVFCPIYLSS